MRKELKNLEDKIKAYQMILKKPATIDPKTLRLALGYYDNLLTFYRIKTGKNYNEKGL